MRPLLVTGASGFVGRHFVAEAAKRGFATSAVGRGAPPAGLPDSVRWIAADLSDPSGLEGIAREYWGVAHFANFSIPADYSDDSVIAQSVAMTARLVGHLRSARFLFPSSCHVYAASEDIKSEDSATVPAGRYGRAKLLAEELVLLSGHIDARVARPFNHIGKYMQPALMIPSLAARVMDTKAHETIVMRGKNSIRDFLDVRDIVAAYFALLELDNPPERIFNVCSGNVTGIKELAERFVRLAGKDNAILFDEQARSSDDIDRLVGDPSRILAMTDWRPRFSLEDSIRTLLR